MMDLIAIVASGFSILVGLVLIAAYLTNTAFPKSLLGVCAGLLLTATLSILQTHHLLFLLNTGSPPPLETALYRVMLFVAPGLFFLFGRGIIFPHARFEPWLGLHGAPLLLLLLPLHWALPALLTIGSGYALWLSHLAYSLRAERRQYRFELLFSVMITATAMLVLLLGMFLPLIDARWFYSLYACGIALAYLLIVFALVAIPDFVQDLFERTRVRYDATTLGQVDVPDALKRLQSLMHNEHLYEAEDLTLSSCADAVQLTSHQLSELINSHLHTNFTQFVRQFRIQAAKEHLSASPNRSILDIAMATGFRSQSTFYAAFKQETGMAPGEYRTRLQK